MQKLKKIRAILMTAVMVFGLFVATVPLPVQAAELFPIDLTLGFRTNFGWDGEDDETGISLGNGSVKVTGPGSYKLDVDVASTFDEAFPGSLTASLRSVRSTDGMEEYRDYYVYWTKVAVNGTELTIDPSKDGTKESPQPLYSAYWETIDFNLWNTWYSQGIVCNEFEIKENVQTTGGGGSVVGVAGIDTISTISVEFTIISDSDVPTIDNALIEDALSSDTPSIKLTNETGTFISADALQAIRESGKTLEVELPNGIILSIPASGITEDAKQVNLKTEILRVGDGESVTVGNITAKGDNHSGIVIAPSDTGSFGFTVEITIPASSLGERGINADKAKLWHVSGDGTVTDSGGLVVNSDGSVTISYDGASFYIIAEDMPIVEMALDPVEVFVSRFYEKVLGRNWAEDPDAEEWIQRLIDREVSGIDIAVRFFLSEEFKEKELSDEEFVELAYQVMLGRDGEPDGVEYWLDKLAQGTPRAVVVLGFSASVEFEGLCDAAGIDNVPRGTKEAYARGFVARLYYICLDREPIDDGIEIHTQRLLDGATGRQVAADFILGEEMGNREDVDAKAFAAICYAAILGRDCEDDELEIQAGRAEADNGRQFVFDDFVNSPEFAELCAGYGIDP